MCIRTLFAADSADKAVTLQMTYTIKFCSALPAWFLDWILVLLITVTLNLKGDSPTAAGTVQGRSPRPLDRQYRPGQNDLSLSGQHLCICHHPAALRSSGKWHRAWFRFDLLDHMKPASLLHLNFISRPFVSNHLLL